MSSTTSWQDDYHTFMVGKTVRGGSSSNTNTTPSPSRKVSAKKVVRQYWQVVHAFQHTLQQDWLDVDSNLEQVMESIAQTRDLLWIESKHLALLREEASPIAQPSFKLQGHGTPSMVLTEDDIQLALDHALEKHETLLGGARMLISSLAQAQSALGRRLDQLLELHLSTLEQEPSPDFSLETVMKLVMPCNKVYNMMAAELCRNQCLVQAVMDTCTDDLLFAHQEVILESENPRVVAKRSAREFSRASSKSFIDKDLLESVLNTGSKQ